MEDRWEANLENRRDKEEETGSRRSKDLTKKKTVNPLKVGRCASAGKVTTKSKEKKKQCKERNVAVGHLRNQDRVNIGYQFS